MKNEMRPMPNITIKRCPAKHLLIAADVAGYGINRYAEWPNSDCVIARSSVWYLRCTSAGNVTVEYMGPNKEQVDTGGGR